MSRFKIIVLLISVSFTIDLSGQGDIAAVPPDQGRELKLEEIWASSKLSARSVPAFNFAKKGNRYYQRVGNHILAFDISNEKIVDTLFNLDILNTPDGKRQYFSSYFTSDDEKKIILETEVERIYRHSVRARYFIWDTETQELTSLFEEGKQMYPQFDPSGNRVAFIFDNDLYVKSLLDNSIERITTDGKVNKIINGMSDWVYEEEFKLKRAYEWSPEGNYIAFIRFDENDVPEFTMDFYNNESYPEKVTYKYPKVGEPVSSVSAWIYHFDSKKVVRADLGDLHDRYIPRIKWSNAPERLICYKLNRHQDHLQLHHIHPNTGIGNILLEERSPYFVSIDDNLTFLTKKKWFIWSSEQNGYQHLYLYDMNGRLVRQLTDGAFDVTDFYGVDEERERIYFQAADESPLTRNIYFVNFEGEGLTRINPYNGFNHAQFSPAFDYWLGIYSTINSPPVYALMDADGKLLNELETNQSLLEQMGIYKPSQVEFFTFLNEDQIELNGYMIKPGDFDLEKKYPVFLFLYGGPNSQRALDKWADANYWWFQMLAQQGFLVACVDNRGTGARGREFRNLTHLQLGHYETLDQIAAAKYLGGFPFVDESRIGIFGWSYGGYLSTLCLLKGNDVFKAAVAVAPVTNWKWYDAIYTERYMRTVDENAEGYKNNSPVYFADRLKGNYLLIHGMADDNVHFQHTAEMASALIAANKQFDTQFYPNKNHSIYGGLTKLHVYTKITNFLKEKL